MNGWRARVGLISPSGDDVEYDFNNYAPKGVSFCTTRAKFPGPTPEGLIILSDQLEKCASVWKDKGPLNVILFGCTSGSCIKGYGFDKECIERIERVVITPYPEATNQAEKKFMEDNGLEVLSIEGYGFNKIGPHSYADKQFLYRNAKKQKLEGAEVFFLSCMGLDTIPIVNILEEDLGIPVITSRQASLWACLRHAGIKDKVPMLGKLGTL